MIKEEEEAAAGSERRNREDKAIKVAATRKTKRKRQRKARFKEQALSRHRARPFGSVADDADEVGFDERR